MSVYRKEWPCCDSVTETQAWEPDGCPFCTVSQQAAAEPTRKEQALSVALADVTAKLEACSAELASLRMDAAIAAPPAQAPVQQSPESWLAYVDPECTSEQDKALHTVSGFRAGQAYNALCNMLKGHRFPDSFIENEAPAAHEFFMALFGVDAAPVQPVQQEAQEPAATVQPDKVCPGCESNHTFLMRVCANCEMEYAGPAEVKANAADRNERKIAAPQPQEGAKP